jgi:hypothetical protein
MENSPSCFLPATIYENGSTPGGQQEGLLNGRALGLVHGGGIAVIKRRIILDCEADLAPFSATEYHAHRVLAHFGNRSQAAVLHTELTIVLEEHHAIAGGEVALAALDAEGASRWSASSRNQHSAS